MISRLEAKDLLRHIGTQPDEDIDLAEAALALAALDHPDVSLQRYRDHLSLLAEQVGELNPPDADTLEGRVTALQDVLVGRHGYEGDTLTYDDIQNANMMQVIDRKKGLPVALGILFIQTARAQGWAISGLNFPGHFLVRLEYAGERVILDPFNQGQSRSVMELRDLLKVAAGAGRGADAGILRHGRQPRYPAAPSEQPETQVHEGRPGGQGGRDPGRNAAVRTGRSDAVA